MALVQALLAGKLDRNARPYLRGTIAGMYDTQTAAALARYRTDNRDQNPKQALGPSGAMLSKLAMGQWLAVLEGTITPYRYSPVAEAGPIKGPQANGLGAGRKADLMQVLREIARDWGIAFDVEVKAVTANAPDRSILEVLFNSRPLVGHFVPRAMHLHNGSRLYNVLNTTLFRARAKKLYEALAADIEARCGEAFAIEDPVDVKIQRGLDGELACLVRTDLEGVEALARFLLAQGRKRGFKLAVRFFEHYLGGSGSPIELSREEALEFDRIREAVETNLTRFKEQNFISPEPGNPAFSAIEEVTSSPNTGSTSFQDHWKRDFILDTSDLIRILTLDFFSPVLDLIGLNQSEPGSLAFGPGSSSLTSTGQFDLRRQGDRILVTGTITHRWTDPRYDFDPEKDFFEESRILERHHRAKRFEWKAEWRETVEGVLEIAAETGPGPRRQWVRFQTRPSP